MGKKLVNIIEDDKIIMSNLIRYINLQEDQAIGLTAHSVEDYFKQIALYPEQKFDTLLLDIGLPGQSGLEALPRIREEQTDIDIIMLTTFEEENIVLQAMCNGAVAYISKRTPLPKIMEVIQTVQAGGSYMSPMIARDIFNYMLKSQSNTPRSNVLSARQLEILEKIVDGKPYKVIAKELFISPETVRTHIKAIYKALEVNNKAAAVKKYLTGYR
ncbi:MAG: response regulator transcription factor [Bacteroidota bacterium]